MMGVVALAAVIAGVILQLVLNDCAQLVAEHAVLREGRAPGVRMMTSRTALVLAGHAII